MPQLMTRPHARMPLLMPRPHARMPLLSLSRYIYSLYWAVTTISTVDQGDHVPSTMAQVRLIAC